jgi:stage II sporulation protein B
MDKGNNRISIKINGNERSFEDDADSGVKKEVDSSKSTDKEILQPFTYKKETAAAKEEENDEFSWVLPNEDEASSDDGPTKIVQIEDVRNKSKKGNPYFKNTTPKTSSFNRRPSSALKTLLLSIFLAVIVGLGLGAMILNLISEEDHQQAIGTPTVVPAGPGTNNGEGKESSTNAGASALELAPINIAYAQEGVYTNKEAVDDLVKTIKQSGFPSAAVEIGDSYTVVVGIGTDKEIIKEIGKLYEAKSGKATYHKVIEVEGGSFSKANENDVNYIKDGQALFTQLSSLSSNSFSAKSISDEQWTSISKLQEELKGKISDDMSDSLKSFSTSLTNAYEHLGSYKKSNDDATLLKSQQELLNAFQFYQQWKLSLS